MPNVATFDCSTGKAQSAAASAADLALVAAMQAAPGPDPLAFLSPGRLSAVQTVKAAAAGTGGVTQQQFAAAVASLLGAV